MLERTRKDIPLDGEKSHCKACLDDTKEVLTVFLTFR